MCRAERVIIRLPAQMDGKKLRTVEMSRQIKKQQELS